MLLEGLGWESREEPDRGKGCKGEGLQSPRKGESATMKDRRRLRQEGSGSPAGDAGEARDVGSPQGARDGAQTATRAMRRPEAPP